MVSQIAVFFHAASCSSAIWLGLKQILLVRVPSPSLIRFPRPTMTEARIPDMRRETQPVPRGARAPARRRHDSA
jgi:hypothetical protein